MIDFGLAKRFRDPRTHQHIPYRDDKKLTGTARYTSVGTHLGVEQSRRDDLEGLGYTLIYLAKGGLPWQGIKGNSLKERYNRILEKKMAIPIFKLCEGLPDEFTKFMNYCSSLGFEDKPDYLNMRKCFINLFVKKGYKNNFKFDWDTVQTGSCPIFQKKLSTNGSAKADYTDNKLTLDNVNKNTTQISHVTPSQGMSSPGASPPILAFSNASLRSPFTQEEFKEISSPVSKAFKDDPLLDAGGQPLSVIEEKDASSGNFNGKEVEENHTLFGIVSIITF